MKFISFSSWSTSSCLVWLPSTHQCTPGRCACPFAPSAVRSDTALQANPQHGPRRRPSPPAGDCPRPRPLRAGPAAAPPRAPGPENRPPPPPSLLMCQLAGAAVGVLPPWGSCRLPSEQVRGCLGGGAGGGAGCSLPAPRRRCRAPRGGGAGASAGSGRCDVM